MWWGDKGYIYIVNSFGGYKIILNDTQIDIWVVSDLEDAIEYNIDGLFYDLKNKTLISNGFKESINENKVIKVNSKFAHPNKDREDERKKKLIKFLEYYKK